MVWCSFHSGIAMLDYDAVVVLPHAVALRVARRIAEEHAALERQVVQLPSAISMRLRRVLGKRI